MNIRTRVACILIALALLLGGVGVTMAFIASSSSPVINTFTVGNIALSLTETTGTDYQLIPGTVVNKDPKLTVKAGSDTCWLFFRMTASQELAACATYAAAEGWTLLSGSESVYYRQVDRTDVDIAFPLLQSNQVRIKATLTEEQLAALQASPTLSFTGYAIQNYGIATAEDAWQQLISEGVTVG